MREIVKLFKSVGHGLHFIILLIFRCPFDAMNTFIQANFLRYSFDAISQNNGEKLAWVCLIFGLLNSFLFLYNGTVWTLYSSFLVKFTVTLRNILFSHISDLPYEQIEMKPSAEWITRLNADAQTALGIVGHPLQLPHAAYSIVNIIISAIFLVHMNPVFFVMVLAFIIPHMLISQLFIARHMTKLAIKAQEETSSNTSNLNTIITCADTAILYDARDYLLNRYEESSLRLLKANMKLRVRSAVGNGLLPLLGMSGYLLILLVASDWISKGKLTFGELTSAFQYRGGVLVGFMILISCIVSIKASIAGIKRVNETLELPLE